MDLEVGQRLQILRKRCCLSIRQLATQCGVTASMISSIERGKSSPSIVTLQKILSGLGTDLLGFLSEEQNKEAGPVFKRENMQLIQDPERSYTVVFPKKDGIYLEMLDEQIHPAKKKPILEKLKCDIAGYVLSGNLVVEIKNRTAENLRPGDAFYIPSGTLHRGFAVGEEPVRLVTLFYPNRY